MRTGIAGMATPHPLEQRLPGTLRDSDFVRRMAAGFDEVLAPVFTTLDSFEAYLDPALAPDDFVPWLAGWVAIQAGDAWTPQQRRAVVAQAVQLHRWRGTLRGLAEQMALLTGGQVDVADTGGCTWSAEPSPDPAAPGPPSVRVRVRVAEPSTVDSRRLRELVAAAAPAHVSLSIEVIQA